MAEQTPAPGSLDAHARGNPQGIAVVDGDLRRSWEAWEDRACRLGSFLRDRFDLEPGDRVAWMLYNRAEHYDLAYALQKIGCLGVPIGYRLTGPEAAYIIDDSDAKAIVCQDVFAERLAGALVGMPRISEDRFVVVDDTLDWRRHLPKATSLEEAVELGHGERFLAEGTGLSGSIIYTSGTTGRPKGAFRDPGDPDMGAKIAQLMIGVVQAFGYAPPDTHLLTCPLYHSAPPVFALITHVLSGTVVIQRRFDAENTLRVIQDERISSAFVVPTMLNRIFALPEETLARYDLSSMKRLIVGAAPFPYPLKRKTVELFPSPCVYEFYGATETGINTVIGPEDQLRKPGSCGKVLPTNDIRIVDDEGDEVPEGEIGTLYVKNPILITSYYKNKKATDECIVDGYFTVGDMAKVDEEGFYYIVDRKGDMIISGGVNIYPAEIEAELRRHPDVYDCAVIGVPNEEWGEEVKAVVQLREGAEATADEIREFLAERTADYKVPRTVDFVDELPYNPSGKLVKKQLRAKYWEDAGRSI
jgi:fatty-acyl-CoA synthase/long-chain acyl-CoA synthetase